MKIRGAVVGTPIKPEKVLVKSEKLTEEEKAIARNNIGAVSALIVTIGEDGKASHTSKEIFAHVQLGGTAVLDIGTGLVYSLAGADDVKARFLNIDFIETGDDYYAVGCMYYHDIDVDGNTEVLGMNIMDSNGMQNYIYEQIGTIEAALDSILKIQNELIGGDNV